MLSNFLNDLFQGKALRVGAFSLPDESEMQQALVVLQTFERTWRLDLSGAPPAFASDAAVWAAKSLYLACSLVVHREVRAEEIDKNLNTAPPDDRLLESHYAVDLTMRFLPELIRLAKSASANDPLLPRLLAWARQWPMSSVGVANVTDINILPLRTSPTLMRLYVDRILATGDTARLVDPEVRKLAATAIGSYPELHSKVADSLKEELSAF